ncbi:MAG TPA: hypothetical protein VJJ76_00495 [archaeon]|nr:hypothetical protein [archaeon]
MQTIGLNAILLPDETVKQASIEMSQKLSLKYDVLFTLDGIRYHPHITIYQALYPERNYRIIVDGLREVASSKKQVGVNMREIVYYPFSRYSARGFVHWNCESNQDLLELQKRVLDVANPLREGLIPEGLLKMEKRKLVDSEVQSINTTGSLPYPFHITITRLRDSRISGWSIPRKKMSFTTNKLYLGRLGDHGTVVEILKEFPFRVD